MNHFFAFLATAAVPCVTLPPVVITPPVVMPPAPPVAPAGTIATPANVQAAIAAAKPGDTITLASGSYPRIVIKGKTWATPITLDATAANITQLTIDSSSGVKVLGGTFSGAKGVSYLGYSAHVLNSRFVSFTAPQISNSLRGIVIDMSSDVDVTKAAMTGLSVDGIDISRSQRVKVTYSSCTAFKTSTAHPDCIQAWSRPGKITSDVLVAYNTMDSQNTQGIFFGNHVRNGVDDGGFDRITITYNTIRGSYPNGIAVAACRACTVTDNKAVTMLGSKYKVNITLYGKGITAARNVLVKE